jgi:hypothetical protein
VIVVIDDARGPVLAMALVALLDGRPNPRPGAWPNLRGALDAADAGARNWSNTARTVAPASNNCLSSTMEPIRFTGLIRYWNPDKASGLAVTDIPAENVAAMGGLKQQRVRGRIAGAEFTSNVMPAGGGKLALSVSKAMMKAANIAVGDTTEIEIHAVGRESGE